MPPTSLSYPLPRRAITILAMIVGAVLLVGSMIWVRSMNAGGPHALMVQPAASSAPVVPPVVATSPTVPILAPPPPPATATLAHRAGGAAHHTSPSPSRSSSRPAAPPATPPPPPPPAAAVTATFTVSSTWDTGFIGALSVQNVSGNWQNWTVTLRFDPSDGVRIGQAWNATLSHPDHGVWVLSGASLAPGSTMTPGFEATKRTYDRVWAQSCTVNGLPCVLR